MRDAGRKAATEWEAKRVLNTQPGLALENYTGRFSNEIYGDADVSIDKGELTIKFPNKVSLSLKHWHYDTFRGNFNYEWYGHSWIKFEMNKQGKVVQFDFDGIVYQKK